MTHQQIQQKYAKLELKQLKSKNDKVKSQYIHLAECNIGRNRELVTFTVSTMNDKQEQLLLIKDIKNYFAKRLQNLKSDVQYFATIELGEKLNNPHLHFQLFYNDEDKKRIDYAFTKTLRYFKLDKKRNKQTKENGSVSDTTSHNYIIKEFDNKKLNNKKVVAINKARGSLKKGNSKYIQFHSQSRSQNPHGLYKKMWIDHKMNYFDVNNLLSDNFARRLTKIEFLDKKSTYSLPFINFYTGMIKLNTIKLYNLVLLTYLYLVLNTKSSERCIYKNKRVKKRVLTPSLLNFLYNSKRNRLIGINNGYE